MVDFFGFLLLGFGLVMRFSKKNGFLSNRILFRSNLGKLFVLLAIILLFLHRTTLLWAEIPLFPLPPILWDHQITPLQTQLHVDEAWGLDLGADKTTKGAPNVHICVIDSGFNLAHPEFTRNVFGDQIRDIRLYHDGDDFPITPRGVYLNDEAFAENRDQPPGASRSDARGTAILGIPAARWDENDLTGIAGRCSIFGLKTEDGSFSASSVGRCIKRAVDEELGAGSRRVILLPHTDDSWSGNADFTIALTAAVQRSDVLIIAPSGNNDTVPMAYPANEPVVMVVGAVDYLDRRAVEPSEVLFSNYGDNLSVVAPGLFIWTTDLLGDSGYSSLSDQQADFVMGSFSGTEAAVAHVGGVAAQLFSRYPFLTASQVREIIERTADKVKTIEVGQSKAYEYTEPEGGANARNLKMGFGRINAFHAMDLGDVMISDWYDGDTKKVDDGAEPSNGVGPADIVILPAAAAPPLDDSAFNSLLNQEQTARLDYSRDNTIYVRIRNRGPNVARNVRIITVVVKRSVTLEFPTTWRMSAQDDLAGNYVFPEPLFVEPVTDDHWGGGRLLVDPLVAGESAIVEFTLTAAAAQKMQTWGEEALVAAIVVSDNDYVFSQWETSYLEPAAQPAAETEIMKRNNLAVRNIALYDESFTCFTVKNPKGEVSVICF